MNALEDRIPQFQVLINDEGQFSLWPKGKQAPSGWSSAGISGSKEVCCAYVEQTWTDMRPRSLQTGDRDGWPVQ